MSQEGMSPPSPLEPSQRKGPVSVCRGNSRVSEGALWLVLSLLPLRSGGEHPEAQPVPS